MGSLEKNIHLTNAFPPFALQVELTSHCNLKCQMCALTAGTPASSSQPGPMREEIWERVLEAAACIRHVRVSGYGEALISAKCLPRLRELDELGVQIGLSTNGTPLTSKLSRELAKLRNLVHVNISIDSPDPDVYRHVRGEDLDKVLSGVRNLMNALENKQKVSVSSVLMDENLYSLIGFPKILAELGVQCWSLQSHYDDALGFQMRVLGIKAQRPIELIKEAAEDVGIKIVWSAPDRIDLELRDPEQALRTYYNDETVKNSRTRNCSVPWEVPYIDKDGRVFPCCHAATSSSAMLGNLREATFAQIWTGERFRSFRSQILKSETTPAVCQNCQIAPLVDEHVLSKFSAEIIHELSDFDDFDQVSIVVRNKGSVAWTRDTPVHIGTAMPRDRNSDLFHDTWVSRDRAARFAEDEVFPGALATFNFRLANAERAQAEPFQLVVDGAAWLPGTNFELPAKGQMLADGYNATLEEGIRFNRQAYPGFVHAVRGFSHRERLGRWTDGFQAVIEFVEQLPRRFLLILEIQDCKSPVRLRVGDWTANLKTNVGPTKYEFRVKTWQSTKVIDFSIAAPVRPIDLGPSLDERLLGVFFKSLSVRSV